MRDYVVINRDETFMPVLANMVRGLDLITQRSLSEADAIETAKAMQRRVYLDVAVYDPRDRLLKASVAFAWFPVRIMHRGRWLWWRKVYRYECECTRGGTGEFSARYHLYDRYPQ